MVSLQGGDGRKVEKYEDKTFLVVADVSVFWSTRFLGHFQ
jgi:hypothetical protein